MLADGYSAADLLHGPIAAVDPEVPVLVPSVPGPAHDGMAELAATLRERGVPVVAVGVEPEADLPLPAGVPESLAGVPAVVRGGELARGARPRPPARSRRTAGLSKVTRA